MKESPQQQAENNALKNYSPIKKAVVPAAVVPAVPAPVKEPKEEIPEEIQDLTVAELKAALDEAGIEYPSSALKADLRELYNEHIASE